MHISKLSVENFMGYRGQHEWDFKDKDVIGIIAEYEGNPKRSNQAGKTTTIEAIRYALTGLSRANKDVELIHHGEDVMNVTVNLIEDGKEYVVRRGRDIKNNGVLELDWIEKTREAQSEIDKLIGFNKSEFELITFFKQAEINQFMEMSSTEKKKYILQWFNSNHWTTLEAKAKEELTKFQKDLVKLETERDVLKKSFENDVDLESDLEIAQMEVSEANKALNKAKAEKSKLEKSMTLTIEDVDSLRDDIFNIQADIESITEENEKMVKLDKNIKELIKNAKSVANTRDSYKTGESSNTLVQKLTTTKADLATLKERLRNAEENKSGICPILKESCDRIKISDESIAEWKSECEEKKRSIGILKGKLDDLDNYQSLDNKFSDYKNKIARLKDRLKKPNDKDIPVLQKKVAAIEEKIAKGYNPDLKDKISEIDNTITAKQNALSKADRYVGSIEMKIDSRDKNMKEVDKLAIKIEKLAVNIDDHKYVVMMFGKNGIPSQEVENGFQGLEDVANMVLDDMGTGSEITFKPTRELNSKEPNCLSCGYVFPKGAKKKECPKCGDLRRNKVKDEIQISIKNGGQDYAFHMDSGGGKAITSLSVRMSLTHLKRSEGGAKLNVVFLDEPDSSLDDENTSKFVDLVTKTLKNRLGVEQVFWVSHNKSVQNSIPHVLKVIKSDEGARANWV